MRSAIARRGLKVEANSAGGLVLGSVLAGSAARSAPVYVEEDEAPRRCYTVERVNRYGKVIGLRRVCRSVY